MMPAAMGRRVFVLSLCFASSSALAAAGAELAANTVIRNIAIAMVAASVLGVLMKLLRQPLILGYLLGGVLVGPIGLRLVTDRHEIETVSEIGLILLLFMIGLEIDLKKMLAAGKLVIVTGALQFPLSVAVAYGLLFLLTLTGLGVGIGKYALLYIAVAVSLSSTMIVVKLLYEKSELDTLAGRLTVGILVFQDIWAIIVLAIAPNLANPEVAGLLKTFGAGIVLVAVALMASRYVLPKIFQIVAKVPEMMLVISLGWCFLIGLVAAHPSVGLSMEMGALIAGVALATFPYNLEVNAKVLNIRDFFITLFFVSLGMQIPVPRPGVIAVALVMAGVLWLTRLFGVFGILHGLKAGHFTSILPTINLSQMSEFALVILAIGVSYGHIARDSLTLGIWTFSLMAVASTYQINSSHGLERFLSKVANRLGLRDLRSTTSEIGRVGNKPVVLLGFYRIANAFLTEASLQQQHLLDELKVVDFNPEIRARLQAMGMPVIYGDLANADALAHAKIQDAKVIVSTVPDSLLRGTTNLKLLKQVRELAPRAEVVVTAESPEQALELYSAGADYVLQPSLLAGEALLAIVEQALRGSMAGMRSEAEQELEERTGKNAVLPPAAPVA